jgi:hypothetical protein
MINPEEKDGINDFHCVQVTIGALFFVIGLVFILADMTVRVFNIENKYLKYWLVCLYNLMISFMPGVRLFLSPLMVPELNWQIYRYTAGLYFIFAVYINNKFFSFLCVVLYVLFFYCIAKHEADSKKDKNS